ncbi:MAG TPA: hypothetical protein VGC41_07610 [Kofleriaceae bacterium]
MTAQAHSELEHRVTARKRELISELVEHKKNSCRHGAGDAINALKNRLDELAILVKDGINDHTRNQLDAWIMK